MCYLSEITLFYYPYDECKVGGKVYNKIENRNDLKKVCTR